MWASIAAEVMKSSQQCALVDRHHEALTLKVDQTFNLLLSKLGDIMMSTIACFSKRRLASIGFLGLLCCFPNFGQAAQRLNISEFRAEKTRLGAQIQTEQARCDQHAGNMRDICREEARAKELVALAELTLAHTGTSQAREQVRIVKLDTAYYVARVKCNGREGVDKRACTRDAQEMRIKGEADLALEGVFKDALDRK